MEAVKLKKDAFRAWLSQRDPEAAHWYRVAERTATSVVGIQKQAWEEFREVILGLLVGSGSFDKLFGNPERESMPCSRLCLV